jgi:methylmalonyl-CoA mutase
MVADKEFDISTEDSWKSKILSDLKGKPLASLVWESEIGLVDPILFDYATQNELPATFPFKRGYQAANNNWKVAQTFDILDAKSGNNELLKALRYGINHLRIRISKAIDFTELFSEVMLDIISTEIICTSSIFVETQKTIKAFLQDCYGNQDTIECIVSQDPISDYFRSKIDLQPILHSTYTINAGIYAEAGATIDKQIAYALAHGHEYIIGLLSTGAAPADLPSMIRFELAVGTSYFLEISKIRAFRTAWATILAEYNVEPELAQTEIHIRTSSFYYSNIDIHNNLLRSTTAAMAGVVAGCQTLEILPYDHFLPIEKQAGDGIRLATNIQLILREEAYLNQVADAAGGAYYMENITDQLIGKSWELFKEIEKLGGMIAAFNSGKVIEWLNTDLSQRKEQYVRGELSLIGTNKFPNANEKNAEITSGIERHAHTISSFRLAQL